MYTATVHLQCCNISCTWSVAHRAMNWLLRMAPASSDTRRGPLAAAISAICERCESARVTSKATRPGVSHPWVPSEPVNGVVNAMLAGSSGCRAGEGGKHDLPTCHPSHQCNTAPCSGLLHNTLQSHNHSNPRIVHCYVLHLPVCQGFATPRLQPPACIGPAQHR
jgi:hypothetical protein